MMQETHERGNLSVDNKSIVGDLKEPMLDCSIGQALEAGALSVLILNLWLRFLVEAHAAPPMIL